MPVPASSRHKIVRRCLTGLAVLVGLVFVLIGGVAAWLSYADQRALAERFVRKATGREVTVEGLRLTLGREIAFEMTGVRLPNASWSQHRDMARVERLTGAVDALSLLATPKFSQLRLDGYEVRLERGPERVGNWRFDGKTRAGTKDDSGPRLRGNFPFLLDFAASGGRVTYRTSSGSELRIDLRDLSLRAADLDVPVMLAVQGAYNGKAVTLGGKLGTYRELHDVERPFPTVLKATVDAGTLQLDGTMMRPLDVDGIDAALHIALRDLGGFIGVFGKPVDLPIPLTVDTKLTHAGAHWLFADLKGVLADMPVTGDFAVEEAPGGSSDSFDVKLAFDRLDVDKLLPKRRGSKEPTTIGPEADAAKLVAAITAKRVDLDDRQFFDAALTLTQAPDTMAIEQLRFTLWQGKFQLAARSTAAARAPQFTLDVTASGIDAASMLRDFGVTGDVTGRLDLAASLAGTGDKAADLRQTANGQAIVSMGNGRIATSLLEMASADLRALFRTKEGMTPITCFATVARIRSGMATVMPMRLRTATASFLGGGHLSLSGDIDLTVGSNPDTTGSLALDIPVHITGSLANPTIRPGAQLVRPAGLPGPLGGQVRALAERNPCAR